jgi:hypothetical protein
MAAITLQSDAKQVCRISKAPISVLSPPLALAQSDHQWCGQLDTALIGRRSEHSIAPIKWPAAK